MKRIFFLTAIIFALTAFRTAANQTVPHVNKGSGAPERAGIENIIHEKRFLSNDLKTVKKKERVVEGEQRIVRFERNHRIGHVYRLT